MMWFLLIKDSFVFGEFIIMCLEIENVGDVLISFMDGFMC